MKYIRNITEFYIPESTVISLGKFDGIHRGHMELVRTLKRKHKEGLKTVIFTFDMCTKQNKVLTTNEEKMKLFLSQDVDYLIECPFTTEIMNIEPEDFVEWIVKKLNIKSMVVGTDFRFGHNRRGDAALLERLSLVYGYEIDVIDKVQENGIDISSTYIRNEIMEGNLERANLMLGYPYYVSGVVVHGNAIGRTLNVPTANLIPSENKILPPFGVYITRTIIGERTFGGITNVGCKPTIQGENPIGIENHIFDFDEDIYGEEIKVEFLSSVRGEKKFSSLDELKKQMMEDIVCGKKYYANVTKIC